MLNNKFIIALILVAAVIIPYYNIFYNGFAYDDIDFFKKWEGVKSLRNIPSFFLGDLPMNHQHAYRPVRGIMQAVVYHFSKENTFGYHLFSILVHLASVFFIYLITKKILDNLSALVTATIFAVLPIHTEAITFMTASFDIAGITFLLASFYFYILSESGQKKYFFISLALAALAFFTYEVALVLPLLIILYDACVKNFTKTEFFARAKTYASYFALAMLFFTIRYVVSMRTYNGTLGEGINFFSRMVTMPKALLEYLYMTIVNIPLNIYHDITTAHALSDPGVLFSLGIIFALIALGIYFYKKGKRLYAFIIFWFFISLIPVSNIVQIALFFNERYAYLASFAWALLCGLVFQKTYSLLFKKNMALYTTLPFIILSASYAYMTWQRNGDWENDKKLWSKTIEQNPKYASAYVGLAYYNRDKKDYGEAEKNLNAAMQLDPEFFLAHESMGEVYMEQKKFTEAIPYFQKAILLRDNYASSYHNIAFSYHSLGQLKDAEINYLKAIEIYPRYFLSNKNLAAIYLGNEEYGKAIQQLKKTLEIQNNDYELYYALGISYLAQGEKNLAEESFQETLEIKPDFAPAEEELKKITP